MKRKELLSVLLALVICLSASGFAEAGSKGGHPDQFPYPYYSKSYFNSKKNCTIYAYQDGRFDVYFDALGQNALMPARPVGIAVYLYDPTSMSNTLKKLSSTQKSYLDVYFGLVDPLVPVSEMTATADAKKARATVKLSDDSLEDGLILFGLSTSSVADFRQMLAAYGFSLVNGFWTATCSAPAQLDR